MKKNLKVIGIASGIGAEKYGANLGVFDIYSRINSIDSSIKFDKLFYHNHIKNKLEAIDLLYPFYAEIIEYVKSIYNKNDRYLFMTGDHSCAIATWTALMNSMEKSCGLIWVDAHLDCHSVNTSYSKNIHGMPCRHLIGMGESKFDDLIKYKIDRQNICFIGTRDYEKEEREFIDSLGIKAFYMEKITEKNFTITLKNAMAMVSEKVDFFGVSLDMDSMDPEVAPATGCYNPLGLSLEQIIELISVFKENEKFKALELTEYNPLFDEQNKTFEVISAIIREYIK